MSTRTHTSYLSNLPTTTTNGSTTRRLKKEERLDRGGNVLPPQPSTSSSIYRPGSIATNGGNTYRDTGRASSVLGGGSTHGALTKTPRILGGLTGGKEKRLKGREELSGRNMKVDADGVAHDSEYVQFRTATPSHAYSQRSPNPFPNDDDSASSSSASSSSSSNGFPSAAYTYQSTHRTSSSTHQYSNKPPSVGSALPAHLTSTSRRPSGDYASSSLQSSSDLRRPPSNSNYDYAQPTYSTSKATRTTRNNNAGFTTSSYQPPAPAFAPRAMDYTTSLRLPSRPVASSSDANSMTESAAQLSINGGSGYNQYASSRPPKLDGTALDAGVHGMKRSWDGFKLEMKFGAHKVNSKLARKMVGIGF